MKRYVISPNEDDLLEACSACDTLRDFFAHKYAPHGIDARAAGRFTRVLDEIGEGLDLVMSTAAL